ncbi:uncharacterized protein SPSK_04640 [Sporothrix schenckii 1099-18]|uniref:Uncharacterized protein n=1 Tax=Sporothrix schenckii 1099-18 TaxID=1397361 RepID=A0A0F2M101_SPOSC|nr:uncharacterized protein SPSK_04640 [Sporothrix schenckii 1099-18]KJR83382.1 hypothetical protein SPSK_04640 [Sporothrix schenckii 1099-18]
MYFVCQKVACFAKGRLFLFPRAFPEQFEVGMGTLAFPPAPSSLSLDSGWTKADEDDDVRDDEISLPTEAIVIVYDNGNENGQPRPGRGDKMVRWNRMRRSRPPFGGILSGRFCTWQTIGRHKAARRHDDTEDIF